jgi:hypothetical protein
MTNKWLLLPDNLRSCGEAHLGFDQIVSLHFCVFEYGKMREDESVGVSIYSSKSAACIFKDSHMREVCFLMVLCTSSSSPRSLLLI